MHGRGIHRCRDVHKFQAESAARERELANVAKQRDIGVVDSDGQIGLVMQAGGLIAIRRCASGIFLGRGGVTGAGGGIKHSRGEQGKQRCRGAPRQPRAPSGSGNSHRIDLFPDLLPRLERGRRNFLQSRLAGAQPCCAPTNYPSHSWASFFQVSPASMVWYVPCAGETVACRASTANTEAKSSTTGGRTFTQWAPPSLVRKIVPARPTTQHT